MEFIKEWSFCICISLIISVIFSLLAPKGTLNRFYKILLSVFILISFIYPLKDFKGFDFDFSKIGITSELQTTQNDTVETMLNNRISTLLSDNGIEGYSISSDLNYDLNSGEIEIKDIQIAVPSDYDCKTVKQLVFDELGFVTRVINIGD